MSSFNNPSFNNPIVGPAGTGVATRHLTARDRIIAQADQHLRTQNPNLSNDVQAFRADDNHPDPAAYEEIRIFDPTIAEYLARIFCFASPEIARAADFPIRVYGSSRFDSPRTPVIARTGHVTATGLLSQRPSYLKAILVHSRGSLNTTPCSECRAAYERTGEFKHYAGCVSILGWWRGACSNCIHDDHAARCTHAGQDPKPSYEDWMKQGKSSRRSHSPPNTPRTSRPSRQVK